MAQTSSSSSSTVKIIVSIAAIVVGLFLVFFPTTPAVADGIFVAAIALALAVYLWSGVTTAQARTIAVVLLVLAAYAIIRGFGLLELTILRQVGGHCGDCHRRDPPLADGARAVRGEVERIRPTLNRCGG